MFDLPPPDPGIEVVVASHGMSKGVAQTEGPQLVVKPLVKVGVVQFGAQWKNVSSSAASGEAAVFVGLAYEIAKVQLSLQAAHKFQTAVHEPADDHSWEFTGGVNRKFGKVSLKASVVYSPDDLGGAKQSVYVEGGPTLDLSKTLKLSANVGHRGRKNGDDYTSFNGGIAKTLFKGVTLDARYYGTNRSSLGEFFEDRVVISARMSF